MILSYHDSVPPTLADKQVNAYGSTGLQEGLLWRIWRIHLSAFLVYRAQGFSDARSMKRFIGFFPGLLGGRSFTSCVAASEKPAEFHRLSLPQLAVEMSQKSGRLMNCGNAGNA